MTRGTLRIYLGAAPGVGKTFAMLNEGHRRRDRGGDVVVGFVETHGREKTAAQIGDLEVLPRRTVDYRGTTMEEMDLDAVLRRAPEVALIDELAHTNVPGSRHTKRFEDVEELLAAGITVISTVNIQHLESINDVVEQITGVVQRETIPDGIVRDADQVELVDMTPEALRRRMAHGNVYASDTVDAALSNYFRAGNLTALRELALLWIAGQVDEALDEYRAHHGITVPWETRERIVVAVTGAPSNEKLIRRAARMAQRSHGDLLGLHVRDTQGLTGPDTGSLESHRALLTEMGGELHEVASTDIAAALVDFAVAENATQLVLGSTRQTRWQHLTQGSIVNRVLRRGGEIDVHVIAHDRATRQAALPRPVHRRVAALSYRRRLSAWVLVIVGLPTLTAVLESFRSEIGLPSVIVLYLLYVVVIAAVGGLAPALVAACAGFAVVNWFFTPPLHRFSIAEAENVFALVVYLVTAGIVSGLVAVATRRSLEAARARAEAQTLSALAGDVVSPDPLPTLLSLLRRTFGLAGVALLRQVGDSWVVEAADGEPLADPSEGTDCRRVGTSLILVLLGDDLAAEDRRVLNAFAAHLSTALERRDLQTRAADATALAEANALRSALLQAVSHDLRTPLAGIKASVTSLRQPDLIWSAAETSEFLETIEDETDRMTELVENLLDMSRIHSGAVAPLLRSVSLDEVIPAAIAGLGPRAHGVCIDIEGGVPSLHTDPGLLERVIANLVDNALSHGQGEKPVRVEAGVTAGRLLLRVVDHGRGLPVADRARIFAPFQRLDDARPRRGAGVGLGLAVAQGFTTALGGTLEIEDTPGGGTTMVIELGVDR